MDDEFDTGKIITRKSIPIAEDDSRERLYKKLYNLAGALAVEILPELADVAFATRQPEILTEIYAKRLNRSNGFVPWSAVNKAMGGVKIVGDDFDGTTNNLWAQVIDYLIGQRKQKESQMFFVSLIERAVRAFYGFPGLWTRIETSNKKQGTRKTRMKLLEAHVEGERLVLDKVQIEGKEISTFNEAKSGLKLD